MGIVIDAEVVKGYVQDTILGKGHDLTDAPAPLFDKNRRKHNIYVDDSGIIKQEWSAVVNAEWLEVWYTDGVRDGTIVEIPAPADLHLKKKLAALGFPSTGRDIWYARVSNALSTNAGFAILVSEDLDFFEPKEKKCGAARRTTILIRELGNVRRYFFRERNVHVKAVARYVMDYPAFIGE